jgi:hypothetical protein
MNLIQMELNALVIDVVTGAGFLQELVVPGEIRPSESSL